MTKFQNEICQDMSPPSIFPIEFEGISGKEKSRIKEIDDKS